MTLGPDRTLYIALYGGAPFDVPPAAIVSLAPTARTRPGQVQPNERSQDTPPGLQGGDTGGQTLA
jgi:hypothetical protein